MHNQLETWQLYFQTQGFKPSQEAFNVIWMKYYKPLLYFIQNMIRHHAEDLLQEIMMKVYQNLDRFKPWYSFNTWIYTIARNHCINYLKKRKLDLHPVEKWETIENIHAHSHNPEHQLLNQELHQHIDVALQSLDCDLRQIAFLRFYEGMKCRDIAQIMEIPTGTVKSRLHHIRQTIKKELESYDEA
ncbi:sigma-70 family RNA polymerase sigma factor [bacterium]|nr:sigma-70 family RNA polymerase sigma factor [bacterium]RQV94375.1 MAG: sigma-70 family RNA polymerase sigma factor [bacterium]